MENQDLLSECRPDPKPQKPQRDKGYMQWLVANHSCLFCGHAAEQVHHDRECGPCGMGQKPDDRYCLPVCSRCHDAVHSMRGERYGIIVRHWGREERQAAIIKYLIEWKDQQADAQLIREANNYLSGGGFAPSVQQAAQKWREWQKWFPISEKA